MRDPSTEQARIYETRAEEYDALISAEDVDGELARALDRLVSIDGAVIADVGAGTGRIARTRVRFTTSMTPMNGGEAMTHAGSYFALWHRGSDGVWRIERYADVTDLVEG